MLKQRKSIIGLDIGSSCIKAVEITQEKFDYIITAHAQIDIPGEQARQDAISDLFSSGGFRTKRVSSAVSGKSVIFRYINMASMPDDNIRAAIRLDADKYIPFEVDEVQLDTQKLMDIPVVEGSPSEMKVLLVAAKNSLVEDQAQMLIDLGLQPVSIGVDSFALGNAYELCDMVSPGIQESDRTIALLDIGSAKSSINIIRNSVTCFAREVTMGGHDLTNAITRRFGLEPYEAEALKRDPQEQLMDVQDAVSHVLDDLGNEVNLSFDFFENQFEGEVDEVYLSGGSVMLPFLEESLEKIFEKKTRVWNPIEGLKVKSDNVNIDALQQAAPQLAVALGLAAQVA
ncbi:MAG: type IV pilus assembly protein PilM [Planctomycetes bacterium]|nr:type IV pilus assembly protein PilM [Planctomycetota bacterium]MCB9868508.1 type IV pilus assembly protein PilM [Planctomycetota bacterium]